MLCDHCNSPIESNETHLPMTGKENGKETKYCEVRFKWKESRKKST